MDWDHVILNGTIIAPNDTSQANIYVKDGKIAAITNERLPGKAIETTDAAGKFVLPGFIETHSHSRDGKNGPHHKEDFAHATAAGAVGGFTTLFEMPNCNPAIINVENLNSFIECVTPKAYIDFCAWGMCLGAANLDQILPLSQAGVVAFKIFEGYAIRKNDSQLIYQYEPGMDDIYPPLDDGNLYKIFREVGKTGKVLGLHAENFYLIRALTEEMKSRGDHSYGAFLDSRPASSELSIIQTSMLFSQATGTKLHVCHLAAGEGVEIIRHARQQHIPVTVETCPHYLELTDKDFPAIGSFMKCYPLVRRQADQDALWQGVQNGTIDFICSDHAPHTIEEKQMDLWDAPAGITNIETIAPLLLTRVNAGQLSLNQLAALLSANQAKIFGLYPQKGAIQIGSDADLVIIDIHKEYQIDQAKIHSKIKASPYHGRKVQGKPIQTILRGKTIAKNDEIMGNPEGKFIRM